MNDEQRINKTRMHLAAIDVTDREINEPAINNDHQRAASSSRVNDESVRSI
jgi:hypothetical protein